MTKEKMQISDAPAGAKPVKAQRRSQAERSQAMRRRLLDATLECLASDGYAGTTVSSIVRRAGVSRGAHLHHYPTKEALILAAAERLMRRIYRVLGEVLLDMADEDNRLEAMVDAVWDELFSTSLFDAFSELLVASQRDAELARAMRELTTRAMTVASQAMHHYFESRHGDLANMRDLFVMTPMMLSGIATASHLSTDAAETRRYLRNWTDLMADRIRAIRGVHQPPPRPPDWDRPTTSDSEP